MTLYGLTCAVLFCLAISTVTGNDFPSPVNASDYRLRYRDPSGCEPDQCNYFVGINTNAENESFLDFYLVGRATGWVAVGFSETDKYPLQYIADVVGCSIHEDGTLPLIVDTYNSVSGKRRNILDDSDTNGTAEDVIQYSKEYTDGWIICNFSRLINGIDPYPQDLPLNGSYHLQFGLGYRGRNIQGIERLSFHKDKNPTLTVKKYNPVTDSGDISISTFRANLIAAHGILMLVAWPVLSFTAILFATWMKPALPNGQWFKVHRAFNLASLFVAVVGFTLVFVAHKDKDIPGLIDLGTSNPIGTVHFILGLLIMGLQIINPIISTCRCKPDDKYRWVFFLLHGLIIGYGLQTLVYVNAGIGVKIYGAGRTSLSNLTLLWIYLAFAIFSVILTCVLFAVFTVEAIIHKDKSIAPSVVKTLWQCCNKYTELTHTHVEMDVSASFTASKQKSTTTDPLTSSPAPSAPKVASRDAPIRWLGMIAFLLVMVATMIVIIVLMIVKMN